MKGILNNMKLDEFISHIKHSSVNIKIIGSDTCHDIYIGSIGTYQHWIHKNEYNDNPIDVITFNKGVMNIFLEGK